MSTKSGIVVCRASYRKVFSASFRRMSFSTATPDFINDSGIRISFGVKYRIEGDSTLSTITVSLRLAAIVAGAVIALPLLVAAQSRAVLIQRYGNPIGEVYRTSNHLTVTTYFDEHGNICREHIESENRGRRMTDKEVNTVLDEIAPKEERGKYKMGTFLNVICLPDNDCAGVSEDYERLFSPARETRHFDQADVSQQQRPHQPKWRRYRASVVQAHSNAVKLGVSQAALLAPKSLDHHNWRKI